MAPRYGIQFYPCGQIYYFTSPDTVLTPGTPVVVDTGHGENLGTVVKVFEDFTYHRTYTSEDGMSAILEFSAKVNGKELKGIDQIRFDEEGKIVDFEVMVRPMSGLQALGDEMAQRLAPYIAMMKGAKA